jgi:hypothetical protein
VFPPSVLIAIATHNERLVEPQSAAADPESFLKFLRKGCSPHASERPWPVGELRPPSPWEHKRQYQELWWPTAPTGPVESFRQSGPTLSG